MLALGLVTPNALRDALQSIQPKLIRFPRIDERDLRERLDAACVNTSEGAS
jgi:hypothetical protein